MKYVIELDLLPLQMAQRQFPITRRFLIEAEGISEAMEAVLREERPGQDCVAVRVLELED